MSGRVKRKAVIVEVGPRDGLQNEAKPVPTGAKLELIRRLSDCGISHIEATAFVSPRWVPQMADHESVMRQATRRSGLTLSALVPNEKGAAAAIAAGAQQLAVFTAASETFCQRNTNCSIEESIARFSPVLENARSAGLSVRGYISCCLDCPYEGPIAPQAVARVAARLRQLGCSEIVFSDTIGKGTPERTKLALTAMLNEVPVDAVAGHFHDTSGLAVANVEAAWGMGVGTFDGSVAGLGGCPYAPGAAGNVSTEALCRFFDDAGIETGIDRLQLAETGRWIRQCLAELPAAS
jgi:hydroxymethylglutaryl-CoA lyase